MLGFGFQVYMLGLVHVLALIPKLSARRNGPGTKNM
jgi:hypothetical protein